MSQERLDRIKKMEQIRLFGVVPYASKFDKKDTIWFLLSKQWNKFRDIEDIISWPQYDYKTAGRMTLYRTHGKLSFAKLLDESGEIQLIFHRDYCNIVIDWKDVDILVSWDQEISAYKFIEKLVDIWDWLGVEGELFHTHKWELTLFVSRFTLLSKAIRPLGDKFHGVWDNQETAYRQRYLDMIHNRETIDRMKLRSQFIKTLREFYWKEWFIELDTPILWNSASGAAAKPFVTHHDDYDLDVFLRIAPEIALKMATVWWLERVFEIWKDFRNEWSDPSHHQEFLVAEHYALYWNYEDNIRFTEDMFNYLFDNMPQLSRTIKVADKSWNIKEVTFGRKREKIDYIDRIKSDSGIDVSIYSPEDEQTLRDLIKSKWYNWDWLDKQTTATMIDYLYKKVTRPKILGPAFIYNYPKTMQPLARTSDNNPHVVEQFQAIINWREILKAYSELVDPVELQSNFDAQAEALARGDDEATKSDDEFVISMEYGMAPQSWWGMWLDRILAMLTEQSNVRDVIMFPLMKPLNNHSDIGEDDIW